MKLLLKLFILAMIMFMTTSICQAYPVSEDTDANNNVPDFNVGDVLSKQELIKIFTKQGNDPQDIASILRENNVNKVVFEPEADAIKKAAKSTDDWYKERQINDYFNPRNLKNGENF